MKVTIQARGQSFDVTVPDALTQRAVQYAMGVIAQRETASMADDTEANRIQAIADRFAKIGRGEWSESGGRSADPATRILCGMLRRAEVYKKGKPAYKPAEVPGASDAAKVTQFCVDHFTPEQREKLSRVAANRAKAEATTIL